MPQQLRFDLPEVARVFETPADYRMVDPLPELHGFVALDLETKDPGIGMGRGSSWAIPGEGFVCGASIHGEHWSFYLSIGHAAGNMDESLFWRWLRCQAAKPDVIFIMANAVYDVGWCQRHGVVFANAPVDVQTQAYLLNEHRRSYGLNALSRDYLNESKGSSGLVEAARAIHIAKPMENMDKMPAWMVAPYAIQDASLTYRLYHHLMPLIEGEDLQKVLDLESECTMVSADMRRLGVRVDLDRAAQIRTTFVAKRAAALAFIKDATGIVMKPFENEAAAKALRVENPGVVLGITDGGKDSVRKEIIDALNTPVAKAISTARKFDKAVGTFIDGYLMSFARNGRIHAEFHACRHNDDDSTDDFGTTSGRWSSSNPNLQNIPARDPEIGPHVRSCFIPEDGEEWLKLDYASQEPRLTIHFAALARQRGAQAMADRFNANPRTDLHGECAALMGIPRPPAKIINLALAYGMQGASLCRSLGLPTKFIQNRAGKTIEVAGDEGQRLLDLHFQAVPFMKGTFELAKKMATRRGYVLTLLKRRIRFEKYPDGNYARVHKALNGVIQGSAGDQMKLALVGMRKAGIPINLTVHDEADKSKPRGEEGERLIRQIVEIMETCCPLVVPMIAEYTVGANWGALD